MNLSKRGASGSSYSGSRIVYELLWVKDGSIL